MIGCLLVARFPLACELLTRPELRGRALVVARPDAPVVWVASTVAEQRGVLAGQSLREAMALCPTVEVIEGRPVVYDTHFAAILSSIEAVVPGVEPGAMGVAYMMLDGLSRLYDGIAAQVTALLRAVPRALQPRIGIAPDKFTAYVAAVNARPNNGYTVSVTAVRDFLGPQPIDILPLPSDVLRRLRLLGIATLGALAELPRSALLAQFGRDGERAWLYARGGDHEPVRPRAQLERLSTHLELDIPLSNNVPIEAAFDQLMIDACRRPAFRGRAARQAWLRLVTERGDMWSRTLTFKEPLATREQMWPVVRSALTLARPSAPVSELGLELGSIVPMQGLQGLLPIARGGQRERLDEALRTLRARYGRSPISRVVELEPGSRIPERRVALVDYAPPERGRL